MLVSVRIQKLAECAPLLLETDLAFLFLRISESRTPTKVSSHINLLAPCYIQTTGYTGSMISISRAGLCLALKDRATDSEKARIRSMWKTHTFKEWMFMKKPVKTIFIIFLGSLRILWSKNITLWQNQWKNYRKLFKWMHSTEVHDTGK